MLWATLREVSSCRNDCHIDLSKQPPAGTGNLRVSFIPPLLNRIFALAISFSNAFLCFSLINSHLEKDCVRIFHCNPYGLQTRNHFLYPIFSSKKRHQTLLSYATLQSVLLPFSQSLSLSLIFLYFFGYWLFQLVFKAVNLALSAVSF